MIKSFLGHEDDDLKECRRLVHPGFGRRWTKITRFAELFYNTFFNCK
jgi:hypothetical protein